MVCSQLSSISCVRLMLGSVVRPPRCRWNHQVPRVSLPDLGVTLIRETCTASCEDITPRSSLLQTHSSIPLALLSFGLSLVRGVSAGCYQPLLLAGPSRRYLCESFPGCLGPCHGGPVECICLFLPPRHRPSPVHYRGRLPALTPSKRFHDGSPFRDCSHFVMFRPSGLLASPIVPTAAAYSPQGSRGFYVRAEHASLPPHASDMLTTRPGNWWCGDLHPTRFTALSAAPVQWGYNANQVAGIRPVRTFISH